MPEITSITSEALQATIRRLLPSQQGFGQDLQATNLITPIIDLTPTAEGSDLRADLQTSLAFGSQTAFSASNTSETLANSPGFWRVTGISNCRQRTDNPATNKISLSDGFSTKDIWIDSLIRGTGDSATATAFDYTFYLGVGESISVNSNSAECQISGSYRQVATTTGTLVPPSGFTPQ